MSKFISSQLLMEKKNKPRQINGSLRQAWGATWITFAAMCDMNAKGNAWNLRWHCDTGKKLLGSTHENKNRKKRRIFLKVAKG